MATVGVKKQYTKFQVLSTIIPAKVQNEVKPLLVLKASEFPNHDAYKQLKSEILRIFGPRPEERIERALGRVLTGKPSTLARSLVNDLCKNNLNCKCCPDIILTLWKRQLPASVRNGIAKDKFNKDTFKEICEAADSYFASSTSGASVAAIKANLDETQPGIEYPVQEVAAIRGGRGGRGQRGGRGRGGRGRGRGAAATTQRSGTKHPDLPPGDWTGCNMHFKWGRGSYFCTEPTTCPWKNIVAPKPEK